VPERKFKELVAEPEPVVEETAAADAAVAEPTTVLPEANAASSTDRKAKDK
jgi:hypothetical protein